MRYRKNVMLKETAEKRLAAIREYTDLGSGFKIAMRDLELRGAGNLLGAQQHGHMNAVGYDLYCKMLNEAVKEAKGIRTMEDFETSVDLNVDAYILISAMSIRNWIFIRGLPELRHSRIMMICWKNFWTVSENPERQC